MSCIVDLLVQEGFYGNRSDFIRTAVGNQLDRHGEVRQRSARHRQLDLGLRQYDRAVLEAVWDEGRMLHINVLGLATIADDVTPELARATIASISVLGALVASPEVKGVLDGRIHSQAAEEVPMAAMRRENHRR